MTTLKYSGGQAFRQRIVSSILSVKNLKIGKIRIDNDEFPGLQDFEANFLKLIESLTDGTRIEINETGTTLRFKPGVLIGGRITHDCGNSRAIGWFVEGILPLAPFCKEQLQLTLNGITHDDVDITYDTLRSVTLPLLQNFGIFNASILVKARGVPPKGGGQVILSVPVVRGSLQSIYTVDEGLIKRVRGVAFCTRISPTIITRVVDSCRGVLNDYLPDVHIFADHFKGGKDGGNSPGYSISLIAETTTGALLSIERTAKPRRERMIPGTEHILITSSDDNNTHIDHERESPEDIGTQAAHMLLEEIVSGGVVDRTHQSLILQLMVLTQEDVSKVRFGPLTPQAVETLRLLRDAFGVVFRVQADHQPLPEYEGPDANNESGQDNEDAMGDFEDLEATDGEDKEAMSIDEDDDDEEEEDDAEEDDDNAMDENGEDDEDEEEQQDGLEEQSDDEDESESDDEEEEERQQKGGKVQKERTTYLLSCLGTGYTNVNRRVT